MKSITNIEHFISIIALIFLFVCSLAKINRMNSHTRFGARMGYVIVCAGSLGHALGLLANFYWPGFWSYGDLSHTRTLLHGGVALVFLNQFKCEFPNYFTKTPAWGKEKINATDHFRRRFGETK